METLMNALYFGVWFGAWFGVGLGTLGAIIQPDKVKANGCAITAVFWMCVLIYLKLHAPTPTASSEPRDLTTAANTHMAEINRTYIGWPNENDDVRNSLGLLISFMCRSSAPFETSKREAITDYKRRSDVNHPQVARVVKLLNDFTARDCNA